VIDAAANAVVTWLDEPAPARPGPLAGRGLLVKDLIDTAGVRTTYGSNIYADHVPERTASCVSRLVEAGAIVTGKANLPEFAWSTLGQNPWYGTVSNPTRPGRTTGGSSSGNAAALAGGLCDLGLGTDTGGSIRIPSACCDVVGLKPRYGGIATDGIFPLCPTLDTVGPMARSVREVGEAWAVLTGTPAPEPRLAGLTVGLLRKAPSVGGYDPEPTDLAEGWARELEGAGARVVEAELPGPAASTWPLFEHEALESHAATFPSRADDYGPTIRPKLESALRVRSEPDAVARAYEVVEAWRRFEPPVDLYVLPVVAIDLPAADVDEREVRFEISAYVRWVNLIGWAGLAIGNLQLVAPHDETVLGAGLAWEGR
jgi:Asp-tRNA(Asn)/Glu-tRNA(Gln) amidotransferase A subunit family amidase